MGRPCAGKGRSSPDELPLAGFLYRLDKQVNLDYID